jgi:hypothetical protein
VNVARKQWAISCNALQNSAEISKGNIYIGVWLSLI